MNERAILTCAQKLTIGSLNLCGDEAKDSCGEADVTDKNNFLYHLCENFHFFPVSQYGFSQNAAICRPI